MSRVVPNPPSSPDSLALRVLVVDDEKNIRATLSTCLEAMGCQVREAASPEAALALLGHQRFDLAFLDLRLAGSDGLQLIPKLLAENSELAIVVITAYATIETAVEAMRGGARDYLPKPFTPAQVRHAVEQVAAQRTLARRITDLEGQLRDAMPEVDLESTSPQMIAVFDTVTRAASADAAVLFRGENGTGKGVMARLLHSRSPRAARAFVTVNCPTLSEELLTSELFGHAKGAFTGAVREQPGRVEAA